jgi:hypothetical protein
MDSTSANAGARGEEELHGIASLRRGIAPARLERYPAVVLVMARPAYLIEQIQVAPPPRFKAVGVQELLARPDRDYVIQGIVPGGSDILLAGPSGKGKTLMALDMAFSIASRLPDWHGLKISGGPVAYILAEGQTGGRDRSAAWLRHRRRSAPRDLHFILEPPQLLDLTDTAQLLTALREATPEDPVVIFIDTLAACAAGCEENSVRDMSTVLGSVALLRRETGAAVVLIHHSGWDGKRERGSSALRGAMDVVLFVDAEDDVISIKSLKMRDGAPIEPLTFRLHPVLRSVVLVPANNSQPSMRVGASERAVLEALDKIATTDGIAVSAWLAASEQPASSFYRHRKSLLVKGLVRCLGPSRYALSSEGRTELSLSSNSHCTPVGAVQFTPTNSGGLIPGSVGETERGDAWEPECSESKR